MGSSESTGRSNGTEEEEENRPKTDSSGGGSGGAGTAIAVAAAGAAVAAWGISRMLSGNTDTRNQEKDDEMMVRAPGMEAFLLNSRNGGLRVDESKHRSYLTPITWSPPPPGCFKMNTDGGARPNPGPSGYGGILRDDRGKWVQGFRGFIGESDCLTAEFHGILKGLELLDKLGLRGSILESDSTAAMDWIKQQDNSYRRQSPIIGGCWEIITECRLLIDRNKITLNCIPRDANKCADKLADMAIDDREEYADIMDLPDEIKDIVNGDLPSFMGNSSYLRYPS